MHVLTNAEKLIPLRDAASLAESRRLAGMRMVTGTTSPSTRYERISVSPASCSIKSEYVIASHAFKPQYKCINYTPAWEQRKASEVFQIVDDRGHPTLPVLSATQNQGMIYRDDSGRYIGHDESNEIGYKRVLPGDFVVHLRSFQGGFAHSQYEGITSPAYTVFRAKEPTSHSDRFWKHWFISEHFIAGLSTVTYGIRDGRSISVDEFMNTFLAFPAVEEQAAISRLLDYLDDLITLHQRKYDKLVIFKKSMLEKMFPKDGESVPEIRFAGFTDPWEQRKFVDFVEASGIRNKDNLQLESYSVSNDRGFVPQDEQFENGGTMRDADKTAYWIVEPGSFAYNPARINVGSIGYQSTRKNVIVSSLYEVFKTDHSCDDRFLWHWFKSSLFTKQIEMLQEGGVRLYFFFDKLQKSEIWMPNVDEQRIIGQQFDQLDSLITLHQRKLELLQNIKKSLLDKMFV